MTCHRVGVPCCEDLTEVLNENKTLQTPTKEGGGRVNRPEGPHKAGGAKPEQKKGRDPRKVRGKAKKKKGLKESKSHPPPPPPTRRPHVAREPWAGGGTLEDQPGGCSLGYLS
jgi:hypothetical protein